MSLPIKSSTNLNALRSKLSLNFMLFKKYKPQMMTPRVTPLEGVSTSTGAPVDVAQPSRQLTPSTRMPAHWHTWTRPQGAQPLTYGSPPYVDVTARYAPQGIRVVWESRTVRFRHDERRFVAIIHRKGREERKAEEQKSLCSLRLIEFHGIKTAQGNKATVVFQTGLTGFTGSTGCVISFNKVHPVIMEDKSK
ncbi:MAG: hypothetical protein Q8O41_07685 [Candidatus Methanoperedens sp.]|nr:hypothetical protein [Candidatus Methanoperedens sp.]